MTSLLPFLTGFLWRKRQELKVHHLCVINLFEPGHPGFFTARFYSPRTADLPDFEMKPRKGATEMVLNCLANIVLQINNLSQAKYLLSNKR